MRPGYLKECKCHSVCCVCGGDKPSNRKTCSDECAMESRRATKRRQSVRALPTRDDKEAYGNVVRNNRQCVTCGTPVNGRMTCSRECAIFATGGQPIQVRLCAHCGKEFKPSSNRDQGVYCSSACVTTAKARKAKWCNECGVVFTTKGKFCSKQCSYVAKQSDSNKCSECGTRYLGKVSCPTCGTRRQPYKIVVMTCVGCSAKINLVQRQGRQTLCISCKALRKRDHRRTNKLRREARLRSATIVDSVSLAELIRRDNGTCQICKKKIRCNANRNSNGGPSVDHIIPLAKGGEHSYRNTQLAHRICNSLKQATATGSQMRLL